MFSGIWAKITGVMGAALGILFLLFKSEKSKRKAAELDADTQRANVDLLEKKEKVITDLDEAREARRDTAAKRAIEDAQKVEELKHETNDSVIVDESIRMLNKNHKRNQDKSDP